MEPYQNWIWDYYDYDLIQISRFEVEHNQKYEITDLMNKENNVEKMNANIQNSFMLDDTYARKMEFHCDQNREYITDFNLDFGNLIENMLEDDSMSKASLSDTIHVNGKQLVSISDLCNTAEVIQIMSDFTRNKIIVPHVKVLMTESEKQTLINMNPYVTNTSDKYQLKLFKLFEYIFYSGAMSQLILCNFNGPNL